MKHFKATDKKTLKALLWRHRVLQVRLKRLLSLIPTWRKDLLTDFLEVFEGKRGVRDNCFLGLSVSSSYAEEMERFKKFERKYRGSLDKKELMEWYFSKRLELPLREIKKRIEVLNYCCKQYESGKEEYAGLIEELSGLEVERALTLMRDAERIIDKMLSVRAELFKAVALLIADEVKKFFGVFSEDAFQSSYTGFVNAVEKYRPYKEACFTTYFFYWIKHSLWKFCEKENNDLIRVPAHRLKERKNSFSYFSDEFGCFTVEGILKGDSDPLEELLEREEREERIKKGREILELVKEKKGVKVYRKVLRALEKGDYETVREIVIPLLGGENDSSELAPCSYQGRSQSVGYSFEGGQSLRNQLQKS